MHVRACMRLNVQHLHDFKYFLLRALDVLIGVTELLRWEQQGRQMRRVCEDEERGLAEVKTCACLGEGDAAVAIEQPARPRLVPEEGLPRKVVRAERVEELVKIDGP